MENITKGPNIVFCKICGAMLTWEHPEGSGHYQASSDFIGGDICRSCLAERQETGCSTPEFPYSAGQTGDISESVEHVQIALFQAPFASLHEHGLLIKMYDCEQPFSGPVPSQYYMPVFSGEIEIRGMLPKEPQLRTSYILEQFYCLYNRDDRPNPMTSRSLSVGDVVQLENQFFLCSAASFIPVAFEPERKQPRPPQTLLSCQMALYSRSKYALRTNTPASTLTSCKQMVKTSESASLNTILKKNWGRNCASASIAPQRKTLSITAVITRVIIMQNLYDPPDLCGIDTESSLRLSSISTFHSTNEEVEPWENSRILPAKHSGN